MRAVLLATTADSVGAGAVAAVGAVILATSSAYWLDPAIARLISGVIAFHALRLVRKVLVQMNAAKTSAVLLPECGPSLPQPHVPRRRDHGRSLLGGRRVGSQLPIL